MVFRDCFYSTYYLIVKQICHHQLARVPRLHRKEDVHPSSNKADIVCVDEVLRLRRQCEDSGVHRLRISLELG